VIANVSDPQHRRAIDLVVHAAESGAAVAAVLPPWYYAMEDRDIAEFFATIGRASNLPLMLYNYPEMTGKKISLETIRRVAGAVPVVAVKQSGAEFGYHNELLRLGQELGFVVLSGADTRFEEVLKLGCTGTISGLANAAPQALHTIYENFRLGTSSPAESRLIASIAHAIRDLAFPLNVQAAIAGRGFETGVPKNPISKKTQEAYDLAVSKIREIFQSE
jgi:4-hydroxy-tetrahydrodipicolinate synthase